MWAPIMPCGARAGAERSKYELRRLLALARETQLGLAVPAIEQSLAEA